MKKGPPSLPSPRPPAQRYEEDRAFVRGVRGEEVGDVVVEERQAGGAEMQGVGGEVESAAQDPGFELRGAVAPIAEGLENGAKIGEEKHVGGGIAGEVL